MKRGMVRICISILLIFLLTASAFGATPGYTTETEGNTVTYDPVTKKYTAASGAASVIGDNQYVLLVVKKSANGNRVISQDTIMYVDQKAATTGGISFDFIPKNLPNCEVLLGGVFQNSVVSPVKLGELVGQSVEVSGKVIYQPSPVGATVTVYSGSSKIATATTDVNGNYHFDAIPMDDNYTLVVTKNGYCSYTMTGVNLMNAKVMGDIDSRSLAGDVIENAEININDLTPLLNQFNKTGTDITVEGADINKNGAVNITDLTMVLNNFNNKSVIAEEK
ncbi:MAG: carboxypeptidase regulatory-like domain-containing protein [Anaerovorax sp.]